MKPSRLLEEFPAPSFRPTQEDALRDIREAFDSDNDVVLVRAPTGSGKSLLARSIMGCARDLQTADPAEVTGAYYTTPQVSQLDDVAADDLLEDLEVIRGKSNYTCILPGEHDTPVNQAPVHARRGLTARLNTAVPTIRTVPSPPASRWPR